MKYSAILVTTLIVAIISAYSTVKIMQSQIVQKTDHQDIKESVYARVMRTGTLRCGYIFWPPYYERDQKTGELKGFIKEMVDEMTSTIGLKVEYTAEMILGQQAQDLNTNKYDAVCFDSFVMPVLTKFLDYSKPWLYMPIYLYGRAEQTSLPTAEYNNKKYTFSAMDGDVSHDLATRRFPNAKLLDMPATVDPSMIMLNVATKKADFAIIDPMSIEKFNATNTAQLVKMTDQPLASYPINFSVKKGEVDLVNMLNYAVDIYTLTGGYKETLQKYDPQLNYFIPTQIMGN